MKNKRIILKISGEALSGVNGFGLDAGVIAAVVDQIRRVREMNIELGVVVGGGNFWRGRQGSNMDRTVADHMGMLATIMNSLALRDALDRSGIAARVMSSIDVNKICEPYIYKRAERHFEKGRVVIFAAGTGNPFFSTDTAAALKAVEVKADMILLAKSVNGVYDDDPKLNSNAQKIDSLTYLDVLSRKLNVMDFTAITLCMDNKVPIIAFGLIEQDSIVRAAKGEKIGTLIS